MTWSLPVILCQQGGNAGVLVLQRTAVDLGGVSREDNLHPLQNATTSSSDCKALHAAKMPGQTASLLLPLWHLY